jgi:hypothetical protein
MSKVLWLAGIYNLAWGAVVILWPMAIFNFADMEPPRYPQIWQCVGMIVGVYGIGYLIAASAPTRHWPIVLVGLLGKVFGPIGFVIAAVDGALPWVWGITIITNDLVWWIPFSLILYRTWWTLSDKRGNNMDVIGGADSGTDRAAGELGWRWALREHRSQRGATLFELSNDRPTLVVFLRHSGCCFSRAALHKIKQQRDAIELAGVRLAVVHMSNPMSATLRFEKYGLGHIHRFSDPSCQLYRAVGLGRLTLSDFLTWRVWWRGFVAAVWQGHGVGGQDGDGFRSSGAFLIVRGVVLASSTPASPADDINYAQLVEKALANRYDDQRDETPQAAVPA